MRCSTIELRNQFDSLFLSVRWFTFGKHISPTTTLSGDKRIRTSKVFNRPNILRYFCHSAISPFRPSFRACQSFGKITIQVFSNLALCTIITNLLRRLLFSILPPTLIPARTNAYVVAAYTEPTEGFEPSIPTATQIIQDSKWGTAYLDSIQLRVGFCVYQFRRVGF